MLDRCKKVGPKAGPSRASDPLANHGPGLSNIGSRDAHMPRANHYSLRSDSKSHHGFTDGKRKKGKQGLTAGALENGGFYSQRLTSEAADSPRDIPVDLALDYSLSFIVGTGFTASTSSSKISENRLPKGEKLPCQFTVQKSSGKGKSLGSPYGSKKKTPVDNTPSGEGYGPIKRDDGLDKSKSNDDLGVV